MTNRNKTVWLTMAACTAIIAATTVGLALDKASGTPSANIRGSLIGVMLLAPMTGTATAFAAHCNEPAQRRAREPLRHDPKSGPGAKNTPITQRRP